MKLVADSATRMLHVEDRSIRCSMGRSGTVAADRKREGDGATPLGVWPIRGALLRPDRLPHVPDIAIPWRRLRPDDGWADGSGDPAYNRPVRHPHPFSAEQLWRDDGLYDIILVLGHNDAPPTPGAGSAIFLHCWRDRAPTEGCVAISRVDMLEVLPAMRSGDALDIV